MRRKTLSCTDSEEEDEKEEEEEEEEEEMEKTSLVDVGGTISQV